MADRTTPTTEYLLLGVLALLWGSSYLFIKVAVAEIPPVTLIAMRVAGASLFLACVLVARKKSMPRGVLTWARLGIQAIFNSIAAWSVLAWGQQYVDAGLASVLNSTSPIFVFLFTALVTRHEALGGRKFAGAVGDLLRRKPGRARGLNVHRVDAGDRDGTEGHGIPP